MKDYKLSLGSTEEVSATDALLAIAHTEDHTIEVVLMERDADVAATTGYSVTMGNGVTLTLNTTTPFEPMATPWTPSASVLLAHLQSHRGWLRRLLYARMVDLLTNLHPHLDRDSESRAMLRELLSPRFVFCLISLSDASLLRVCDVIASAIIECWAHEGPVTIPQQESFNDNEMYCVRAMYYAARLGDPVHDKLRTMQRFVVYQIAAFLLRTELVSPEWSYSDFLGRNAAAAAQRKPSPSLIAAFQRLGGPEFDRDVWEHFSPSHGPGAVAYRDRPTSPAGKRSSLWTSGRLSIREKDAHLASSSWLSALLGSGVIPCPEWMKFVLPARSYQSLLVVPTTGKRAGLDRRDDEPMIMNTVPKTWKSRRIIGSESCARMWVQQGLRRGLYHAIRVTPFASYVNLQSTERNIALCRDLHNVTIDLSAASDGISEHFVSALFASCPLTLRMLRYVRPTRVQLDGQGVADCVRLNIYALMGNAQTFPVMCIVFSSIVENALTLYVTLLRRTRKYNTLLLRRYLKYLRSKSAVFGDDIVCPKPVGRIVIRLLERYGFKVNKNKTFFTGLYRESCGAEFVKGINVRPFRLPRAFLAAKDTSVPVATQSGRADLMSMTRRNEDKADHIDSIESLLKRLSRTSELFETDSPELAITLCELERYWNVVTETPTREYLTFRANSLHRVFGASRTLLSSSHPATIVWRMAKTRNRTYLCSCPTFAVRESVAWPDCNKGKYGDRYVIDPLAGYSPDGLPRRLSVVRRPLAYARDHETGIHRHDDASQPLLGWRAPYQVIAEFVEFDAVVKTEDALAPRKDASRAGTGLWDLTPFAAAEWFYGLYTERNNAPQRVDPRLIKRRYQVDYREAPILLLAHDRQVGYPAVVDSDGNMVRYCTTTDGGEPMPSKAKSVRKAPKQPSPAVTRGKTNKMRSASKPRKASQKPSPSNPRPKRPTKGADGNALKKERPTTTPPKRS